METLALDDVFFPSTPITRENFFIGRFHELKAVQTAAQEPGKHILLYGERGVGKTSLTNMLIAKNTQQKIIKKSAHHYDTFSSIWQLLLGETNLKNKLATMASENSHFAIDIATLQNLLPLLSEKITFIIDEFDLLATPENRDHFASLIKYLSDNHPNITLILVGIAGRANHLITQHESLERCFIDFFLPRMNSKEIADLVELGGRKAGFNFHADTLKKIISFSSGYPYYAHMIAKFSCLHASEMHYKTVTMLNFNEGVKMATVSLHSLLEKKIGKATRGKNPSYKNILTGAIKLLQKGNSFMGSPTEGDVFSANEIAFFLKRENREEKNIPYYLKKLTTAVRGEILQPIYSANGSTNYRFKNPLIKNILQKNLLQKTTQNTS